MSAVSNLAPCSSSSSFDCSDMDLPRERGGGVDWNTLGSILTAQCLAEVFHASLEDPKQRLVTSPVTRCSEKWGWRYAYEKHGIVALKKTVPNSPLHCFMGQGEVDLPLDTVASFVGCIESTYLWDRNVTMIKVIETLNESPSCSDTLVYMRIEAKRCLVKAKCDFVYFLRCVHKDGKYIRTAVSVEHPSYPPLTGITRATLHPGSGWVLEPSSTGTSKTLVSYLAHTNVHGIPPVVVNSVIGRHPLFVHYMRSHLMQSKNYHFADSTDDGWELIDSLEESSPLYFNCSESIDTPREKVAVGQGHSSNWHERYAAQMTQTQRHSSLLDSSPFTEDCSVLEFGALQFHPKYWREGKGTSGRDIGCDGSRRDGSGCGKETLPTVMEESEGDSSALESPCLEESEDSGNFSQLGHGSASDTGSHPSCLLTASTSRNSLIVREQNKGGVIKLVDFISER